MLPTSSECDLLDSTHQCPACRQLAADYSEQEPLLLCTLNGAFMFMSDLCRQMQPLPAGLQVDFIRMSRWVPHACHARATLRQHPTCSGAALCCSYIGTQSQGKVAQTLQSKVSLAGRHVLVVRPVKTP